MQDATATVQTALQPLMKLIQSNVDLLMKFSTSPELMNHNG